MIVLGTTYAPDVFALTIASMRLFTMSESYSALHLTVWYVHFFRIGRNTTLQSVVRPQFLDTHHDYFIALRLIRYHVLLDLGIL